MIRARAASYDNCFYPLRHGIVSLPQTACYKRRFTLHCRGLQGSKPNPKPPGAHAQSVASLGEGQLCLIRDYKFAAETKPVRANFRVPGWGTPLLFTTPCGLLSTPRPQCPLGPGAHCLYARGYRCQTLSRRRRGRAGSSQAMVAGGHRSKSAGRCRTP